MDLIRVVGSCCSITLRLELSIVVRSRFTRHFDRRPGGRATGTLRRFFSWNLNCASVDFLGDSLRALVQTLESAHGTAGEEGTLQVSATSVPSTLASAVVSVSPVVALAVCWWSNPPSFIIIKWRHPTQSPFALNGIVCVRAAESLKHAKPTNFPSF